MTVASDRVEPRTSPYFGLDYYQERFGAWFFGRETEGSKIITNLRAARLTLLHAESGVGKSSLLRAGVAWRMRRLADESLARHGSARSVPIVFSSWKDDPVADLTGAIRTSIAPYLMGAAEPALSSNRLNATIETASGAVNANLLIMLDQFEEYFLYRSREPTPERFADELAHCINQADLRANFLIAIREDAYAGLGDLFKGRIANVYGNYLHVDYLDRASAELAIRAPLDIYNCQPGVEAVHIQDALVDAVLDQVRAFDNSAEVNAGQLAANGSGYRIATPLLQLVMETIWERERAQGSHELRLATLQDLRGVNMIVDAHLGKALGALGNGERQTAIDMFDHLVTPSGGKIAESVPDLAQRTGHTEVQVGAVLEKLDRERIVRPVPAAPGQDPVRYRRYEIFHDVLAPTVNRALAAREERRRARRLRRLAASAAGLLIATLAVIGLFAYLWISANTQKHTAESSALAAEANANVARDPELSVLLALQAVGRQRTNQEADQALRIALPELQAVRTFQTGGIVYSAAFDPVDASIVASADSSGVVRLWDVKKGGQLASLSLGGFNAHGTADAVAFNQTGTQLAVGFANGQVELINASGKQPQSESSITAIVNEAVFLGRTGDLAIATEQGVYLWQPQSRSACCVQLSEEPARGIAVDPLNPSELAVTTGSGGNGTFIWNLNGTGLARQQQLPEGAWYAADVAFSPDGSQVATAGSDGKVRVYELATLQTVATLGGGEGNATSVAFSPDGSQIVAGYSSGRARVWDTATWLQLTMLAGHTSRIELARFSADSREVATASDDGTVRVWYSRPRELRAEFAVASAGSTANADIAAGFLTNRRIAAIDNSGHMYVFTPSGAQLAVINVPGGKVNEASSDNAGTLIATADPDGAVNIWRASGSRYVQVPLARPIRFGAGVDYAVMSPTGTSVAIVPGDDESVQVLSSRTGRVQRKFTAPSTSASFGGITAISYSPSGRQIFVGYFTGMAEVWSLATGQRWMLGRPGQDIADIESGETGNEVVTISVSGTITVWAAGAGRPQVVNTFEACPSPVNASPSPDGSKIVVACGDGSASVFSAATGRLLTVLPSAGNGSVDSAAFSPDGNSIVTGVTADGISGIQVWSSELSNPAVSTLQTIAEKRVTRQLTPAERREYLAGISG